MDTPDESGDSSGDSVKGQESVTFTSNIKLKTRDIEMFQEHLVLKEMKTRDITKSREHV